MRFVRQFMAGAIAAALSAGACAQGALVKIDGSTHRVPDHRGRRRGVPEAESERGPRHGRHLRHGRRVQEVLPRRDRHQRRLAADPQGGDGRLRQGRHRVHRAAGRVRRADGRRQPEEHLGRRASPSRAEEDVGARGAGQDHDVEPGQPEVAERADSSSSAPAPTPARSTTSPRRSSARPRPAAATTPPARTTTCSCRACSATRTRSATSATRTTPRTRTS